MTGVSSSARTSPRGVGTLAGSSVNRMVGEEPEVRARATSRFSRFTVCVGVRNSL